MPNLAVGTIQAPESESALADGVSLGDIFAIVRRHIALALVTFIVVAVGTVAVTALMPRKYTATSELFATYSGGSETSGTMSDINMANSYIQSQIKSYPNLTQTEAVLQPVIDDLKLTLSIQDLSQLITVTNPTDTMLVDISVESRSPSQSREIADAVAASLSNVVSSSLYSSNASPIKLSLVQKAVEPQSPSSPKAFLNAAIGVVLGLILSITAALLRDFFDKKIRSVSDLQAMTNTPLMGSVPRNETVDASVPVIVSNPGSQISENYRRIRANLTFMAPVAGTRSRVIVVASAESGEGKTATSVNLAIALAENDARVLLIDADLRHPSVGPKLDINDSIGLTHVLSGQANVVDAVQSYWKENLHILPAGPKPPNASMLLNSKIMTALVSQAAKQYDYVLIDTSPMSVAADAAVFGRMGNGVLLVAGRGVGDKKEIQSVVTQLENAQVPLIGTVLNFAEQPKKSNGNYYYYDTEGNKKRVQATGVHRA